MVARGCFFSVIKSQFQANKETRQARAVKSNVHIYFFSIAAMSNQIVLHKRISISRTFAVLERSERTFYSFN